MIQGPPQTRVSRESGEGRSAQQPRADPVAVDLLFTPRLPFGDGQSLSRACGRPTQFAWMRLLQEGKPSLKVGRSVVVWKGEMTIRPIPRLARCGLRREGAPKSKGRLCHLPMDFDWCLDRPAGEQLVAVSQAARPRPRFDWISCPPVAATASLDPTTRGRLPVASAFSQTA